MPRKNPRSRTEVMFVLNYQGGKREAVLCFESVSPHVEEKQLH